MENKEQGREMSVQTDLQSGSKAFKQPEILLCKGFWYFKFVGVVKKKKQNFPRNKVPGETAFL